MYKSDNKDIWRVFREHHYLTHDLNKACNLFLIYWDEVLVGMCSTLPIPSGTLKYGIRQHRLVILPDYQGLGIGTKVNDFIAKYYYNLGYKYFIRTTHIRLGNYLSKNNNWLASTTNQKVRRDSTINCAIRRENAGKQDLGDKRLAYSFEYVGCDYNKKCCQKIICIGDKPKDVAIKFLREIIDTSKFQVIISGNANWEDKTIWEEVAIELGYRTEILFIKNKGNISINKSKLKEKFDCILTTKEAQNEIKPFKDNIRNMITYDFRKQDCPIWKKIKQNLT